MKLKTKILSSTALIGLAASAVSISLYASLNQNHKKDVVIPTVKVDTSVAPNDIDMNSEYIPFTCENASDNIPASITVELPKALGISMYYRTPVQSQVGWGEWIALEPDGENYIEFEAGYKVQLVGYCKSNIGKAFSSSGNQIKINLSNAKTRETDVPKFKIGGSAYSFLATQDPTEHTEKEISCATQLYSEYEFKNLFAGSEMITEISHNFLPFTEVTKGCYEGMFSGCTRLKTAPVLPATLNNTVSEYAITATTEGLAQECYKDMFKGCSSMQVAPDLPAIKLAKDCYSGLFQNCTILNNISTAYVGNFNETFFQNWVYGVSSVGNIYYNGLDTAKTYNYQIPANFSIVQNQELITNYTETLKVVADETSIVPEEGVQVRAYKDQKFGDITDTLYKGTSATDDDFDHFAYGSDTSSTAIGDTVLVSALTEKNVKPVYLFDAPLVDGWVNCYVSKETTLSAKTMGSKISNVKLATIYYSTNGGSTYSEVPSSGVEIPAKTQLLLRGICGSRTQSGTTYYYGPGYSGGSNLYYKNIKFEGGSVRLAGNCMDLCRTGSISGTSTRLDYIPNEGCFAELFQGSTGIKQVSEGFLPCTKLRSGSYIYMFDSCENLTTVPTNLLPTTEFKWTTSSNETVYALGVYSQMFTGCTSLKVAPDLPATTLYGRYQWKTGSYVGTYSGMFINCSSLENAPTISANKIDDQSSYSYGDLEMWRMFENCTSLKSGAKINISDFSEIDHGSYASSAHHGPCDSMYIGCTSLVNPGDLTSITKLGTYDLQKMFYGCSSLKVNSTGTGTLFFTCPSSTDSTAVQNMFTNTSGAPTVKSNGKYYYEKQE